MSQLNDMSHIITNIKEFISESTSYEHPDFDLVVNNKGLYTYTFIIDDITYHCEIYPNPYKSHCYDVQFGRKGGSTKDRIGRDLRFMNRVLNTITDCVIHFISQKEKVRIIAFKGDRVRTKSYVRLLRRHPYFSNFEIDDSFTKSGFVEIHVNKSTD